jgi:tetratricopeptide (TPR) repeat protein
MNNYISNKILILSLLFLVFHSVPLFSQTDETVLLDQGIELYEAEKYKMAREIFEKLVEVDSESSIYYHWLGKSYGRIAESAPWLTAMSMAKKTRKAFEKAIELDSSNIHALIDLKQYYLDAPGFLGGSNKKAEEIDKILQKLSK